MARFITKLVAAKHREPKSIFGRAEWKVQVPLIYASDVADDTFIVPAGFVTDFASVPRISIAYAVAGDTGHASAVVHDYLCRKKGYPRSLADLVFKEALEVEGTPWWRRAIMYSGVRIGAGLAAVKKLF